MESKGHNNNIVKKLKYSFDNYNSSLRATPSVVCMLGKGLTYV